MSSVINDKCIKCGGCIEVCPAGAITDCGTQMVVNPETCFDCGMCIGECSQGAIANELDSDKKWIDFNKEQSQKQE